ncbi:C40 family peptidase [Streptomyces pathocidini]|uniref:C40 family peptidase n=1 Tax=Streptomyces pathocidini TaxID=1650571 RepID=UPI0034086941
MSGRFVRSVRVAAVAAGTALAVAAPPPHAVADPGERSVQTLLTRLQTLYREAEQASEAYNATAVELKDQRRKVRVLGSRLVRARIRLADGRDHAGRLAREQYQDSTGGLSPYLRMALSREPQGALDQAHLIRRAADTRRATVLRLSAGERRLDGLATRARTALDRQQTLAARKLRQREAVRLQLDAVERTLISLSPAELAAVGKLERSRVAAAQRALLRSGTLRPASVRKPSAAGARAISYAVAQLGKPYVWGAEGPRAFDCSGLTSQAWAHAGRAIPRTSQLQWRRLQKVPLRELRPGDLVVYFKDATHVAIYIGNGKVVQAPRPGARIKVSPIAANPLLGAVRPDTSDKALTAYSLPDLPTGAASGSDTGYSLPTGPDHASVPGTSEDEDEDDGMPETAPA